jgi:hypothetical protein
MSNANANVLMNMPPALFSARHLARVEHQRRYSDSDAHLDAVRPAASNRPSYDRSGYPSSTPQGLYTRGSYFDQGPVEAVKSSSTTRPGRPRACDDGNRREEDDDEDGANGIPFNEGNSGSYSGWPGKVRQVINAVVRPSGAATPRSRSPPPPYIASHRTSSSSTSSRTRTKPLVKMVSRTHWWISAWFMISIPIVFWDAAYWYVYCPAIQLRPLMMYSQLYEVRSS